MCWVVGHLSFIGPAFREWSLPAFRCRSAPERQSKAARQSKVNARKLQENTLKRKNVSPARKGASVWMFELKLTTLLGFYLVFPRPRTYNFQLLFDVAVYQGHLFSKRTPMFMTLEDNSESPALGTASARRTCSSRFCCGRSSSTEKAKAPVLTALEHVFLKIGTPTRPTKTKHPLKGGATRRPAHRKISAR